LVIPTFGGIEVALPASVRPAMFWVQSVELQGSELYTGYAAQVTAF